MPTIMAFCQEEGVTLQEQEAETPAHLTTTLYDLMAALQDVVCPDNDVLVVATIVHLLRSGWLTVLGKASTCRRISP